MIIRKLDDAIEAGTNESDKCTLIITEGDSAKSSALAGVSSLQEKVGFLVSSSDFILSFLRVHKIMFQKILILRYRGCYKTGIMCGYKTNHSKNFCAGTTAIRPITRKLRKISIGNQLVAARLSGANINFHIVYHVDVLYRKNLQKTTRSRN